MNYLDLLKLSKTEITKKIQDAIAWYKNLSKRFFRDSQGKNPREPERGFRFYQDGFNSNGGDLWLFNYFDPKWKHRLPYWDARPLILPLGPAKTSGNFIGINFHHLAPQQRAVLFNSMRAEFQTGASPEYYKLMANYQRIAATPRLFPGHSDCFREYIENRASGFIRIDSRDWEHVVMLPMTQLTGPDWRSVNSGFKPPY